MDMPRVSSGGDTMRLLRPPPRVFTDERGRSVWMCYVVPCELTLQTGRVRGTDPYNSGIASASR